VLEALDASVSVAPLGSKELLFANKLYRQWFGATTEGHLKLVLRGGTANTLASDESLDAVDSFVGLPLDTWPPRRWPSTPRSTWSSWASGWRCARATSTGWTGAWRRW
jgi:hypothetical protein